MYCEKLNKKIFKSDLNRRNHYQVLECNLGASIPALKQSQDLFHFPADFDSIQQFKIPEITM